MYRKPKMPVTSINVAKLTECETIEMKLRRVKNNKEPIKDRNPAPPIWTNREDGVLPGTDIRTDRFEIGVDAADKITKNEIAKREGRIKERAEKKSLGQQAQEGMKAEIKGGETKGTEQKFINNQLTRKRYAFVLYYEL